MSNKAQPAGILTIITGSIGALGSLVLLGLIPLIRSAMTDPTFQTNNTLTPAEIKTAADFMTGFVTFGAVIGILLAIFIIFAGVYTLQRKAWGLGLAGSIVGLFVFFPTAVPALVFTALARPEFEPKIIPPAMSQSPQSPSG
jgi:hypothetical protein